MTTTSTGEVASEQNKNPLTQVDASIRHARFFDRLATGALYVISGSFVLLLIAMLSYILYNGIEAYSGTIFSFTDEGIGNQFFNTIYLVVISLLVSVPLGIATGVYMSEYASPGRTTDLLQMVLETLSSLPSVVVGLFGYLAFVVYVGTQWNLFSGALAVSILSIPLITTTTYNALQALPKGYREGSLALAATPWETIVHVLLPVCVQPIITGIMLAAGRGFGEAAALLYTAGMSTDINWNVWNLASPVCPLNPFRPGETLSLAVWASRTEGTTANAGDVAAAASAVLICLVLFFSIMSRWLGRAISRKIEGE